MLQGPHPSAVGARHNFIPKSEGSESPSTSAAAISTRQDAAASPGAPRGQGAPRCCERSSTPFSSLCSDVVEWEYAKAVAARRAGDKPAAFTALVSKRTAYHNMTVLFLREIACACRGGRCISSRA